MLTQENAAGTDMIVSLFRPAPGVESFLAKNLSEDHTEKDKNKATADMLSTASADTLQKIDLLYRFMEYGAGAEAAKPAALPEPKVAPPATNEEDEDA
jgi:hypothetical protein